MLVNEAFARRFIPRYPASASPVGQRVVFERDGTAQLDATTKQPMWREIVGIVGDVRTGGLQTEPRAELYIAYAQEAWPDVALVVRSSSDAQWLMRAVRQQVTSVNRSATVTGAQCIGIGLVIALPLQAVAHSLLYGIARTELLNIAVTTTLLLGVAVLASLVLALHATRIDPLTALRTD